MHGIQRVSKMQNKELRNIIIGQIEKMQSQLLNLIKYKVMSNNTQMKFFSLTKYNLAIIKLESSNNGLKMTNFVRSYSVISRKM